MLQHVEIVQSESLVTAAHLSATTHVTRCRITSCHCEHAFNGRRVGRQRVGEPLSNRTSREHNRGRSQGSRVGDVDHRGEFVEQVVVVAQHFGLSGDHIDHVALSNVFEQRDDFVSHPHPLVTVVVIHWILERL